MEKDLEKTENDKTEKDKTESETKKESKDNFLKKSEIGNQTTKELEKTKKELINLKKSFVKSLAEKYEINNDIDLDKLNYDSLDNLESSLLKYCEESNVKYRVPKTEFDNEKSLNQPRKKIYF